MASDPKRRKLLTEVSGKKYVSQRALHEILRNVAETGVPDTISQSSYSRNRKKICYQKTPFGPVICTKELKMSDGPPQEFEYQHPYAMLYALCESSEEFRSFFKKICIANGFRLGIALYTDEITPGNPMRADNRMKVQAIYWSILQFLYPVLANDDAWFAGFTGRSVDVVEVDCQLSAVVSQFLKLFFDKCGHNGRNGIQLPINGPGDKTLVFFDLQCIIEDERAHKAVFMNKGATGCKSCFLCSNVCKPGCRFLPDAQGIMVSYNLMQRNSFRPLTIELLRAMMKRLAAVHASGDNAQLEDLEIKYGIIYGEQGMLAEHVEDFDFIATFMWDWFHCLLQDGVCSNEVDQCLLNLQPHGWGADRLDRYLDKFTWPRGYSGAREVCRKGKVAASGSECLSLLPVLALYLTLHVLPKNIEPAIVKSMLLCIECVELLQNCYDIGSGVTPEMLERAFDAYMNAHEAAYGDELKIPKTHVSFAHFHELLRRFLFLIPTFTHERKHMVVKQYATPRHNNQQYSRGILEDVTMAQLANLKEPLERSTLRDPTRASKKLQKN